MLQFQYSERGNDDSTSDPTSIEDLIFLHHPFAEAADSDFAMADADEPQQSGESTVDWPERMNFELDPYSTSENNCEASLKAKQDVEEVNSKMSCEELNAMYGNMQM